MNQEKHLGGIQGLNQDLTCPARLLDRQLPENILYGQANISIKNFQS